MGQKNYIPILTMSEMEKRGQMTMFIIVVIMISAIILFFVFNNQIKTGISGLFGGAFSPQLYLKECIGDEMREKIEIVGKQGSYSSLKDVGKAVFDGNEYAYLCYTSQNYLTCVVQQPLIKHNFEKSLNELIKPKAEECLKNLKREYERKGYAASVGSGEARVEIVPSKVRVGIQAPVSVSKGEVKQNFEKIETEINSELYDLVFISKSIVDYEAAFGDSETTLYMQYYPNLMIQKTKLSDGTTIYKVSDVVTKEEFRFASRSLVWPAGYGG